MNIQAQRGDRIVFIYPWNGYPADMERANTHLRVGETYTVDVIESHYWSATVELQEVPGERFNTVHFCDASDVPTLADYVQTLIPSVNYCTDKASAKAHSAALEWLMERVRKLEEPLTQASVAPKG